MPKKSDVQSISPKTNVTAPIHPGQYVRDSVLTPKKLSVMAAAKLVGVGRPALSNFLNGHVAATPDMASRIEVAFSVPAQSLLDMQAAYDAALARAKGNPINAMPYVVPFLGIKAADIEAWVDRNISARTRLAVLLRTLVNSTGGGIRKIDFPGNDDAERPGWDGYVDATQATPWTPAGLSGWEFGTNQEIKRKADSDYAKSVKATPKAERDRTTFVFVTPRHWSGKEVWLKEKQIKGQWKDVRAHDSSDLEQWLEQSIAAQAWFANETDHPSKNVYSLDKCWAAWAGVVDPPLAGSLFAPAIESARQTMISRLSRQPEEPTLIAADSIEEALAFLAQLFGPIGGDELERYRDRVLVFQEPGVLSKLAQGAKDFIAVAASREVEREFGPLVRAMHTIAVYPRNAVTAKPQVVLQPLNHEAFRLSLEEMGFGSDDITKYGNASGRSLTVLRRRLANVPAINVPSWAADHKIATSLIPFMFVGSWSSTNTKDQAALTQLAGNPRYEDLERDFQLLAILNDAPVWAVGIVRGVISKIDLLYAVADSITRTDLERYFEVSKRVLGEDDPKLDLPEGQRWAAAFHSKSREFSASLREGISETLVLLAVYGNQLFQNRIGFNCEAEVARLVEELLTPLNSRILEANGRDLTAYAEAAPDTFLSILEEDLKTEFPETYALMRPAGTGILDGCPRTGLLWALEGLAWNPRTLSRAALILAQLSKIEINDNWANKPFHSLDSIFSAWMPQTSADQDTRLRVMKLLVERFPTVAWRICIAQVETGQQVGNYSYKPKWRNDAYGFGEPVKTLEPVFAFMSEMANMVLNWKSGHTREMLCDLVQNLHNLSEDNQARVWELVKDWAGQGASESDKAFVRENIRVTVMSRRGMKRSKEANFAKLTAIGKATYKALEPSDLLQKHEWLFREQWVHESADALIDEDMDFQKRDERITKLRKEALRQIHEAYGLSGIFELAEMGKTAYQIGWLMLEELRGKGVHDFLLATLRREPSSQPWAMKSLLSGALHAIQDEGKRVEILRKCLREISQDEFVRMLLVAPFRRSTWLIVDDLDESHRDAYWNDVVPSGIHGEDSENCEIVERLIAAQRPSAAFACVHFELEAIGPEMVFRLLSAIAKGGKDKPGQYSLEQHYIGRAFALMNKCPVLTHEQMAGLEFAYIELLSEPWRRPSSSGIPNLERYVEMHPELFVQAIAWIYLRKEGGEDPPEWKAAPEQLQELAKRGYKLIEGLSRMPGHDDLGVLQADKLAAWVRTVRKSCTELDRLDVGDICIGKLLSRAPLGEDGIWPCEPVRQVLEDIHSKIIMRGVPTGLYNSRGVVARGEGGGQERRLAEKYRIWANALQYSYPFVAHELLFGMVETYEREADREDTEAVARRRMT